MVNSKFPANTYHDIIKLFEDDNKKLIVKNSYGLVREPEPLSKEIEISEFRFSSFWKIQYNNLNTILETIRDSDKAIYSNYGKDMMSIYFTVVNTSYSFEDIESLSDTILINMFELGRNNGFFNEYLLQTGCKVKDSLISKNYDPYTLSNNYALNKWCGCFTQPFNYGEELPEGLPLFGIECMPSCLVNDTVKLINDSGNIKSCDSNICAITDITINTFNNDPNSKGLLFEQICTGCEVNLQNPCICIVQSNLSSDKIGLNNSDLRIKFKQTCPVSFCAEQVLNDDGEPVLKNWKFCNQEDVEVGPENKPRFNQGINLKDVLLEGKFSKKEQSYLYIFFIPLILLLFFAIIISKRNVVFYTKKTI